MHFADLHIRNNSIVTFLLPPSGMTDAFQERPGIHFRLVYYPNTNEFSRL